MYQDEEAIAEKKAKTWTRSIRINKEERQMIQDIKKLLNIHTDGTAIKVAAKVGLNVLQSTFSADILQYLTSERRKRELQE